MGIVIFRTSAIRSKCSSSLESTYRGHRDCAFCENEEPYGIRRTYSQRGGIWPFRTVKMVMRQNREAAYFIRE